MFLSQLISVYLPREELAVAVAGVDLGAVDPMELEEK